MFVKEHQQFVIYLPIFVKRTSILAFDLTSCEAISTILLDVKVEY